MRKTCEIIADVKDGKEVTYEELKMACIVQSSLLFFFQQDTKALIKGGISAEMKKKMEYSDPKTSSVELGIPSWYWKAMRADPFEWLSPRDIPGTDENKKWQGIAQKLLDKALKESEN